MWSSVFLHVWNFLSYSVIEYVHENDFFMVLIPNKDLFMISASMIPIIAQGRGVAMASNKKFE